MLFLKRRMCSSRVRACIRGVGRVSPRRHGVNMRCILGGGGLCARTKRDFYVFRKDTRGALSYGRDIVGAPKVPVILTAA